MLIFDQSRLDVTLPKEKTATTFTGAIHMMNQFGVYVSGELKDKNKVNSVNKPTGNIHEKVWLFELFFR